MPTDNLAKNLTLNFPGGSLTATRGLLETMFGSNFSGLATEPVVSTVSVTGHTRRRVVGGPVTNVAANTYTRKKYPSSNSSGAAGGEQIAINLGGDIWTARLSGSHQNFCDFLLGNDGPLTEVVFWTSEKGKPYGPFPG